MYCHGHMTHCVSKMIIFFYYLSWRGTCIYHSALNCFTPTILWNVANKRVKDSLNTSNFEIELGSGDDSKSYDTAILRYVMVTETMCTTTGTRTIVYLPAVLTKSRNIKNSSFKKINKTRALYFIIRSIFWQHCLNHPTPLARISKFSCFLFIYLNT